MRIMFQAEKSTYNRLPEQLVEKYPDLEELRRQQQLKKLVQEISILKAMRRRAF